MSIKLRYNYRIFNLLWFNLICSAALSSIKQKSTVKCNQGDVMKLSICVKNSYRSSRSTTNITEFINDEPSKISPSINSNSEIEINMRPKLCSNFRCFEAGIYLIFSKLTKNFSFSKFHSLNKFYSRRNA